MRPSLRFLAVILIGWAGVRAATLGTLPGAGFSRVAPGEAKPPPIVATRFPALAPVVPAAEPPMSVPPAAAIAPPIQPVMIPVYYAAQVSRPAVLARSTDLLPQPRASYYGASLALDPWPVSRPVYSSLPSLPTASHERPSELPPPPSPPLRPGLDRLQLTTWALLRQQDSGVAGSQSLANSGQLGASQAGARLIYNFNHQLALVARASSDVGRRGGEVAAGVRVRPLAGVPVWLTAERRQRVGRYGGGRSAFALFVEAGWYGLSLPARFTLDSYLQGGVVGARRRDLFIDGGLAVTRPVFRRFSAGFGIWGGAQPGLARLDAGPRVTLQVRRGVRVHFDWRQKLVGNARPGSGPAVTLAGDF